MLQWAIGGKVQCGRCCKRGSASGGIHPRLHGTEAMNDNIRIEAKLERLREYLREWAVCDSRWRPVRGFPKAITALTDNMKAGVADSSELREGPNAWVMTVLNTQL